MKEQLISFDTAKLLKGKGWSIAEPYFMNKSKEIK